MLIKIYFKLSLLFKVNKQLTRRNSAQAAMARFGLG